MQFMNPARLASARSKAGEISEQIVGEAVIDALIDLRDMLPRRLDCLPPDQEQQLQAQLEARAFELLRAHLGHLA